MNDQKTAVKLLHRHLTTIGLAFKGNYDDDFHVTTFLTCPLQTPETEANHLGAGIYTYRDGIHSFRCLHPACRGKSVTDVFARFGVTWGNPASPLIAPTFDIFRKDNSIPRKPIIEGLLAERDVINIIGSPKARKSMFATQLLLSIVSERPFLDKFATHNLGNALYLDYELHGDTVKARIDEQIAALGLSNVDRLFQYQRMRGQSFIRLDDLQQRLAKTPKNTHALIFIDALYRAFPRGMNENSNT